MDLFIVPLSVMSRDMYITKDTGMLDRGYINPIQNRDLSTTMYMFTEHVSIWSVRDVATHTTLFWFDRRYNMYFQGT